MMSHNNMSLQQPTSLVTLQFPVILSFPSFSTLGHNSTMECVLPRPSPRPRINLPYSIKIIIIIIIVVAKFLINLSIINNGSILHNKYSLINNIWKIHA